MNRFDIDEKAEKLFIYTLSYSPGDVRKHKDSRAFHSLWDLYGYNLATADEWSVFVRPVKKGLKRLVE
ncbi:hypothetical protein [Franconibacter daqui]|uniref:hypothetical protein n=1 Tax=Franconibacter daqui TaxID=2047724 RepID=UPI002DB9968E|nr:hypothetical protein [Franconibacter daqui]MEB5922703.1 hypothetical protein [Franconibacter daqui]